MAMIVLHYCNCIFNYVITVKEEYPEQKRRGRVVVARPKSPSGTPPPVREETKTDMLAKTSRQGNSSTNGSFMWYAIFLFINPQY